MIKWYTNNFPKRKIFAGIGSRPKPGKPVPPAVLTLAASLSSALEGQGYTLRSGAAAGMDEAFESGWRGSENKEIYLPWHKFNKHPSKLVLDNVSSEMWVKAFDLAKEYHPNWDAVSPRAGLLLARNGFQILGQDLETPVDFVLCWTWDGGDSGGTGQAIRIARANMIPVFNLANLEDMNMLYNLREHEWARKYIDTFLACAQSGA